jgi:lipopolysaccharide/colanic/teichoic acid biosynthesis glycosyltransferase
MFPVPAFYGKRDLVIKRPNNSSSQWRLFETSSAQRLKNATPTGSFYNQTAFVPKKMEMNFCRHGSSRVNDEFTLGERPVYRSDTTQPSGLLAGVATPGAERPIRHGFDAWRILDFGLAFAAFIFLLPVMALAAVAVKMQDGGPLLFGHTRIGRDGERFKCLKFRSMVVDSEQRLQALLARDPIARREWEKDHKLKNDPRITWLGRFLRTSSIDELPQLFNVMRGEMSLIGPRPIVDAEIPRYGRWFKHYCSVRPGISGLWQVSGRNNVSYRRRVALDRLYVSRRSFRFNMWIVMRTIPAVLMRDGSY